VTGHERADSPGIEWPVREPLVSDKDARYPRLRALPPERLPRYKGGRNADPI
jgi:hypothetical protein